MAYTDEGVKAKLSALNETQESISTAAQWVLFHRRHADRLAGVWLQKLKDSNASKRLNLIYLANEVVQQSKARRKDDFLIAFSPIVADAASTAYRGATNEVQNKLRRVVEVWKQRNIFEPPIQDAIEARLNEIDKSRSSGKKSLLGSSPFGASAGSTAPPEIQHLVPLQGAVSKASLAVVNNTALCMAEYEKNMGPDATLPSAPVYAARLSGLVKALATASGAVSDSIKARKDLVTELDKLVEKNRAALAEDEQRLSDLKSKSDTVESKKRDVEDEILRGLPADASNERAGAGGDSQTDGAGGDSPGRPQMEELTPPPVETFTPVGSPREDAAPTGADIHGLGTMTLPLTRPFEGSPTDDGVFKKRRMDDGSGLIQGDAMADLDADVAELLRAEGGN